MKKFADVSTDKQMYLDPETTQEDAELADRQLHKTLKVKQMKLQDMGFTKKAANMLNEEEGNLNQRILAGAKKRAGTAGDPLEGMSEAHRAMSAMSPNDTIASRLQEAGRMAAGAEKTAPKGLPVAANQARATNFISGISKNVMENPNASKAVKGVGAEKLIEGGTKAMGLQTPRAEALFGRIGNFLKRYRP